MLTCLPIVLYASSKLGWSSSKGISTVNFTRVGLKDSTSVFTYFSSVGDHGAEVTLMVGAGRLELPISCSQSRRASHYATPRVGSARV